MLKLENATNKHNIDDEYYENVSKVYEKSKKKLLNIMKNNNYIIYES